MHGQKNIKLCNTKIKSLYLGLEHCVASPAVRISKVEGNNLGH